MTRGPENTMQARGAARPRGRALGLPFVGDTGPHNAITDVPDVAVGYHTCTGPGVRTGVTVIFPCGRSTPAVSVWAGQFSFNGNGEMTGTHWIQDGGHFTGPIAITNSHSVGMVHHALVRWMVKQVPAMQTHHHWYMPVVAETYDGAANDINGQHVRPEHVEAALESARGGPVPEGNVGGGAGMMCYEFKGGSGTASRVVHIAGHDYTLGVFIQTNFGERQDLQLFGVPVGQLWPEDAPFSGRGQGETGSAIIVVATDAPLHPIQLQRLARRAAYGMARTGTTGGVNSGDIMIAFSTANRRAWNGADRIHGATIKTLNFLDDNLTDRLNRATVQACEEAIVNALLAAEDVVLIKPAGVHLRAIDTGRLLALLRTHRVLPPDDSASLPLETSEQKP